MSGHPLLASAGEPATGCAPAPYDHYWHWRRTLPELRGRRCRVLVCGALNSCLVELDDGRRIVTSERGEAAMTLLDWLTREAQRHNVPVSLFLSAVGVR